MGNKTITKLTRKTEAAGKRLGVPGVGSDDALDAWRHVHTSAIVARDGLISSIGSKAQANIAGTAHEIKAEIKDAVADPIAMGYDLFDKEAPQWVKNNVGDAVPMKRTAMDLHNNEVGRDYGERAKKEGWSDERLEKELFDAYKRGEFITDPDAPVIVDKNGKARQPIDKTQEGKTKEGLSPNDKGSFLDGIGDTLGSIGSTAMTVGGIAFETAMSIGTDTLVHAVTGAAMNGGVGGGKAALESAAKVVLTQTLNNMHGLVMQEVEKQKGDVFRTPGIAGPIPDTDEKVKVSIERTVNDPKNSHVFHDIAAQIESVLQQLDGADPTVLIVSKVLETLKNGQIKMQPHILVPDMFAEEKDGSMRQSTGDKDRTPEVAGVHIPIRLPDVRVMDEGGAVGSDLHRGADGAIEVKGYTRSDGMKVDGYTRSAPDGIASNNFSFKS